MNCPRCFKEFDEATNNEKCPNCGYVVKQNENVIKLENDLNKRKRKKKKLKDIISGIPKAIGMVFMIAFFIGIVGIVFLIGAAFFGLLSQIFGWGIM